MQHPFYNFEHEDIYYTALINHEMVNSMIECIVYLSPVLYPIVQILATLYIGWVVISISDNFKWITDQHIEIMYILSSLLVMGSLLYISVDMLRRLETRLTKLKDERKELQDYVKELEKENEEMKSYEVKL